MQDLIGNVELGLNHVQVIVRGMFAVAKCDGVHESELVLMRAFYDACRDDAEGLAEYKHVVAEAFDAELAKEILDTDELRAALVKSCVFVAFADGNFSEAEKGEISRIGEGVGLSAEAVAQIENEVRDVLVQEIARVKNVDALREVVTEMG
jgi:uncharacterized membrane protein YebE (DUF533 family)